MIIYTESVNVFQHQQFCYFDLLQNTWIFFVNRSIFLSFVLCLFLKVSISSFKFPMFLWARDNALVLVFFNPLAFGALLRDVLGNLTIRRCEFSSDSSNLPNHIHWLLHFEDYHFLPFCVF